jgi:hypothetical protein
LEALRSRMSIMCRFRGLQQKRHRLEQNVTRVFYGSRFEGGIRSQGRGRGVLPMVLSPLISQMDLFQVMCEGAGWDGAMSAEER